MEPKSLALAYNIRRKSFKQKPGVPAPKPTEATTTLFEPADIVDSIMAKLSPPEEPIEGVVDELEPSDEPNEELAPEPKAEPRSDILRGIMASLRK